MRYTATVIYNTTLTLKQCLVDALATTSGGLPERICVPVPGQIADDACDCGQLALTVNRTYGSRGFPIEGGDVPEADCGQPYIVADITVSIKRCAPNPDDNGNPPTCADLAEAARILEEDRYVVRHAVVCCLKTMRDQDQIAEFQVGTQPTVGPEGGCVGSELALLVGFIGPCCG